MKKLLPIALVAVAAMTFTSCKKDYTCECTVSAGGVSSTTTYTFKDTKSGAESKCNSQATSGGVTATCKIK
jgi:uncharacterized lipoprotein YehR (DUF1307 family)